MKYLTKNADSIYDYLDEEIEEQYGLEEGAIKKLLQSTKRPEQKLQDHKNKLLIKKYGSVRMAQLIARRQAAKKRKLIK